MQNLQRHSIRSCTAGALVLVVAAMSAPLSAPAWAQASGMVGIGSTETITGRATVQAVDRPTRGVTLVGAGGQYGRGDRRPAGDQFRPDQAGRHGSGPL